MQTPSRHESSVVQRLPSSQGAPFTFGAAMQPWLGEQTASRQGSSVVQAMGSPVHWPLTQWSLFVHALKSWHGVPSATFPAGTHSRAWKSKQPVWHWKLLHDVQGSHALPMPSASQSA